MYAGKRRRRPATRRTVQATGGEVKSNPSKRHRDRLNAELDRLAKLLPFDEDTVSKLDKLSILRLSVSYLRNKSFFQVALDNANEHNGTAAYQNCIQDTQSAVSSSTVDKDVVSQSPDSGIKLEGEAQMIMQALNGFVIVIQNDGQIFYASPTIQEHLGYQDADVMHQNVFEFVHKDDRMDFQQQLTAAPATLLEEPGSSQEDDFQASLERNFTCRFRCLLDESSGFLNLHITGKLRSLFGQRVRGEDGVPVDVDPPNLALFAMACPLQQPSIMEIYVRNMIFRTKHELNFKPLALDSKGTEVLGFTEEQLSSLPGYRYLHFEDVIYCSEMHSSLIRKGETDFVYFRLMTKKWKWLWVQAKGRVLYKNGKPEYLTSMHRPMSDEEGEQHLAKRGKPFKFPFAGQAELYDCNPPFPPIPKEILQGHATAGPPGGFPPSGPPMGGPPNGMGDPFASGHPPPGFPTGPPPGFSQRAMPSGFEIPPSGPPSSKGRSDERRPKLIAKRQLGKSPHKVQGPPNVRVSPGLDVFNFRSTYKSQSDNLYSRDVKTFTKAFESVSVQERLSDQVDMHPFYPEIQSAMVSATAPEVNNLENEQPPVSVPNQDPQRSLNLSLAAINNNTDFGLRDCLRGENENLLATKMKKLAGSHTSDDSHTSDLSVLQGQDPGYCSGGANHRNDCNGTQEFMNRHGSNSIQRSDLIQSNLRKSSLSVSSGSSLPAYECGEIPYFDDSISPLTLGDMEVIPHGTALSPESVSLFGTSVNSNQSSICFVPGINNTGASMHQTVITEGTVANMDSVAGETETMLLCGNKGILQKANSYQMRNFSPQFSATGYPTNSNCVNTAQGLQQQTVGMNTRSVPAQTLQNSVHRINSAQPSFKTSPGHNKSIEQGQYEIMNHSVESSQLPALGAHMNMTSCAHKSVLQQFQPQIQPTTNQLSDAQLSTQVHQQQQLSPQSLQHQQSMQLKQQLQIHHQQALRQQQQALMQQKQKQMLMRQQHQVLLQQQQQEQALLQQQQQEQALLQLQQQQQQKQVLLQQRRQQEQLQQEQLQQQQHMFNVRYATDSVQPIQWNNESFSTQNIDPILDSGLPTTVNAFEGQTTELQIGYGHLDGSQMGMEPMATQSLTYQNSKVTMAAHNYIGESDGFHSIGPTDFALGVNHPHPVLQQQVRQRDIASKQVPSVGLL